MSGVSYVYNMFPHETNLQQIILKTNVKTKISNISIAFKTIYSWINKGLLYLFSLPTYVKPNKYQPKNSNSKCLHLSFAFRQLTLASMILIPPFEEEGGIFLCKCWLVQLKTN